MILEFKITNFRSIKDEVGLSLIAESGQSKPDNVFEMTFPNDSSLRLLRSAVIYGSNGSGKTNIVRAIFALTKLITTSSDLKIDQPIPFYDPFLFDTETQTSPTKFEILFAIKDSENFIKYRYKVMYTKNEILNEELDYYPKGQGHNLFKREIGENSLSHKGILGKSLGYKEYEIFKNQLFLSKFGKDIPNDLLSNVYLYFTRLEIWNVADSVTVDILKKKISKEILNPENENLTKKINKLLKIADIKIEGVRAKEITDAEFRLPKDFPEELKKSLMEQNRIRLETEHIVYSKEEKKGIAFLAFEQESAGTKVLFALGGAILKILETGGTIFFDELDNSLHPKLCKFLVRLFNNPVTNKKNAQLIFTTHEVTLLDKGIFRKDQIWITDKDKFGNTDLYSIKENSSVRDDMPFDKWYMNGKFGGQPKIEEIEFIFGDE